MPSRKSPVQVVHAVAPHAHYPAHARHARHIDLDAGDAFLPDYRKGFVAVADGDAEAFGEEFICSATSAETVAESARDEVLNDELAGLSVESLEESDE